MQGAESNITVFLSAFSIFFLIAIGVILTLWIALPFSLFGIKDLLKENIKEQKKTNELLEKIEKNVASGADHNTLNENTSE